MLAHPPAYARARASPCSRSLASARQPSRRGHLDDLLAQNRRAVVVHQELEHVLELLELLLGARRRRGVHLPRFHHHILLATSRAREEGGGRREEGGGRREEGGGRREEGGGRREEAGGRREEGGGNETSASKAPASMARWPASHATRAAGR